MVAAALALLALLACAPVSVQAGIGLRHRYPWQQRQPEPQSPADTSDFSLMQLYANRSCLSSSALTCDSPRRPADGGPTVPISACVYNPGIGAQLNGGVTYTLVRPFVAFSTRLLALLTSPACNPSTRRTAPVTRAAPTPVGTTPPTA